ncbi:MAG: hypothetical protein WCD79_17450 [Chthoniobacteraceae bacterium]
MTAQINDSVFHRKIKFSLVGISGEGLFEPEQHGLKPAGGCSACWRGYFTHYTVINDQLFLKDLNVFLSTEESTTATQGNGKQLFGIKPVKSTFLGTFSYDNILSPAPFTGGLLLADGFIRELYVHMGFHPAWKYQTVRELILDNGLIVEEFDRSAGMEKIRIEAMMDKDPQFSSQKPSREEISAWVERCFSRDYKRS